MDVHIALKSRKAFHVHETNFNKLGDNELLRRSWCELR